MNVERINRIRETARYLKAAMEEVAGIEMETYETCLPDGQVYMSFSDGTEILVDEKEDE